MKYILSVIFIFCFLHVFAQTPRISFEAPLLYPEGVAYDPASKNFYFGSVTYGTIGRVDDKGNYQKIYEDSTLKSSYGMKVDPKRKKLWICTGDANYSRRSNPATAKKLIRLIGLDLETAKKTNEIDLSGLYPGKHFINDLAIDGAGNIYLTDSFSPVIYIVDREMKPGIFAKNELFTSGDVGLNGVVFHKKGFLIVANNSDGTLLKVNIRNPADVKKIRVPAFFPGADGLLWTEDEKLIVVQNKGVDKVFQLESSDDWISAKITSATSARDRFARPTTATLKENKVFVLNSKMNELTDPTAPPSSEFSIQEAVFKPVL